MLCKEDIFYMAIKWGSSPVTTVKWSTNTCTCVKWGSTIVFPDGYNGSTATAPLNGYNCFNEAPFKTEYSDAEHVKPDHLGFVVYNNGVPFNGERDFTKYSYITISGYHNMTDWEHGDINKIEPRIEIDFTHSVDGYHGTAGFTNFDIPKNGSFTLTSQVLHADTDGKFQFYFAYNTSAASANAGWFRFTSHLKINFINFS